MELRERAALQFAQNLAPQIEDALDTYALILQRFTLESFGSAQFGFFMVRAMAEGLQLDLSIPKLGPEVEIVLAGGAIFVKKNAVLFGIILTILQLLLVAYSIVQYGKSVFESCSTYDLVHEGECKLKVRNGQIIPENEFCLFRLGTAEDFPQTSPQLITPDLLFEMSQDRLVQASPSAQYLLRQLKGRMKGQTCRTVRTILRVGESYVSYKGYEHAIKFILKKVENMNPFASLGNLALSVQGNLSALFDTQSIQDTTTVKASWFLSLLIFNISLMRLVLPEEKVETALTVVQRETFAVAQGTTTPETATAAVQATLMVDTGTQAEVVPEPVPVVPEPVPVGNTIQVLKLKLMQPRITTVEKLKALLNSKHLSQSGNKPELVDRVLANFTRAQINQKLGTNI